MGLTDILNGMQNGPRGETRPGKGGMSPVTMAVLALLAYKAYKKMSDGQPGAVPAGQTPLPDHGSANLPGGGNGGSFSDILKNGLGPLGGILAGGAAGSVLSGGLGDLLKQLQQGGQGEVANSWIGTGQNKQISPHDLGRVLGDDTVDSLAEQAGLSKVELLQGLSRELPSVVDELTPQGRIPTAEEMSRMI